MSRRREIVAALAVCLYGAGCLKSPGPIADDRDDELSLPRRPVYGLTVSRGEKWLASYGMGPAIHLQSWPSRKPASRLCYGDCEVACAVFHPSEASLLACYVDGSIVRWTLDDAEDARTWRTQLFGRLKNELLCCDVSPDGDHFAVGNSGGDVTVWSLGPVPRIVKTLEHANAVWSVRFSPDGSELAVVGKGPRPTVWNVDHWQRSNVATGHRGAVSVVAFTDEGGPLLIGGYDGTLELIDRNCGRMIWSVDVKGRIRTIGMSPDGRVVAVGKAFCGDVQLRDARTGRLLRTIAAHRATVSHVRFLTDGTMLTSSHDGGIEAFDVLPELRSRRRAGPTAENPKSEIRNPKSETNSKHQIRISKPRW